jgi:L(+)-tartrate dehydratase beta subunit
MTAASLDQVEMKEVRLRCPVEPEALRELKLGDLVYLDGMLYTGREGLYQRYLGDGIEPPVPLAELSNVLFHCSPAANRLDDGSYLVKAVTATASFRFGKWMDEFFRRTGVKLIIGKGGMTSADYKATFVPNGALYLTTVGYGLGATYGRAIRRVHDAHWLKELGIAQAIWVLEVERMGPFIVESDMAGNSLFELSNAEINRGLAALYENLPEPTLRRFGETVDRKDELF